MAKEKFLIVAVRMLDDCFNQFSESENRANISAGVGNLNDPYSWIEATYEIQLRRYREATHICSVTPSAHYIWLQNAFVGDPNGAWLAEGDSEGLELESGGEYHGYGTYRDEYDPAFICESFTIDTMRDLDSPLRKSSVARSLSRRSSLESDKLDSYHQAIWKAAEETAHEFARNGLWCDALETYAFRQRERQASLCNT